MKMRGDPVSCPGGPCRDAGCANMNAGSSPSFHALPAILVVWGATDRQTDVPEILAGHGYRVKHAHGGKEGLQQAACMQPDLILVDAALQEPDGFEVCRRLKEQASTRDIPVLFMTASCDASHRAQGYAAGGADFVGLPLRIDEVLARIATHLRLRAQRKQLEEQETQLRMFRAQQKKSMAEHIHASSESEKRYRDIFDNVSDLLYLLDLTGDGRFRFVEVNPAVEKLFRMPRREIVGKHVEEVIPRAEALGVIGRLNRCLAAGTAIEEEAELEFPWGHHAFEATFIPIREINGGRIYRIASIARDITIRKQHEAALQERAALESLLRKITEVAPGVIGTYRLSPDGGVSMPFVSPKLEEITGYKPEEMMKDASYAYRSMHPDDLPKHIASIRESARTLSPWHNEYRLRHPVKGEIWIEGRSIPELEPDGSIIWYGFLLDVTKRKRAEEMLHASEQKFRTLAENLPDLIIRYDRDCRRVYVNQVFERVIGLPADFPLNLEPGAGWRGSLSVEDYRAILRKVMDTGESDEGVMSWITLDGQTTYQIFHVVPERDREGQVIGALVIGRNITALKEAEFRLEESRAQLRELAAHRDAAREEERKHIARELHDDLGQFLSALRMHASMLRMQFGKDNPALTAGLNGMIELVDRNIQAVRNISSSLRPTVLDMGMEAALEWLAEEFAKHNGIPCELELMEEKVEMEERCATALFRVVQESLTNVARHADASAVQVSLRREGAHYRLTVRDNGSGFDPGCIPKKSLGLIGMRERVLMLGGEIHIHSAPGKGCMVEVQIPADERMNKQDVSISLHMVGAKPTKNSLFPDGNQNVPPA